LQLQSPTHPQDLQLQSPTHPHGLQSQGPAQSQGRGDLSQQQGLNPQLHDSCTNSTHGTLISMFGSFLQEVVKVGSLMQGTVMSIFGGRITVGHSCLMIIFLGQDLKLTQGPSIDGMSIFGPAISLQL